MLSYRISLNYMHKKTVLLFKIIYTNTRGRFWAMATHALSCYRDRWKEWKDIPLTSCSEPVLKFSKRTVKEASYHSFIKNWQCPNSNRYCSMRGMRQVIVKRFKLWWPELMELSHSTVTVVKTCRWEGIWSKTMGQSKYLCTGYFWPRSTEL